MMTKCSANLKILADWRGTCTPGRTRRASTSENGWKPTSGPGPYSQQTSLVSSHKRKIWTVLPGRRWWGRRRSSRSTCWSPPGRMSPLLGASPLPGFLICISINIIFSFTFIFNSYSVQHPTADGWPTRSKRWSWRTRFARTRSSTTTGSGGPHTRRREGTPARDRFNILSSKSNILCTFYIFYIQYWINLFQGGVPAFVGFNAGNGTKSFAYMPYSQVLRCFKHI